MTDREANPIALGRAGLLGLLGYSLVLMTVAILLGGGGHGVRFPIVIFFAPVSLLILAMPELAAEAATWAAIAVMVLSWPLFGVLLRRAGAAHRVSVARGALVMHYFTGVVGVALTLQPEEIELLSKGISWLPVLIGLGIYLAGQTVVWRRLLESRRQVEG